LLASYRYRLYRLETLISYFNNFFL